SIGSPPAIIDDGGLRNSRGSSGRPLPISAAWARELRPMPTILLGIRSVCSVEGPRTRGIRMGGKVGQLEGPVIDPPRCSPYNLGEMARATNLGAPQRVSAHVVPKAPSFSSDDEEEKTTIESGGWEEEASTTVEQGEVAEKVRALATLGQAARSNT